MSSSRTPQPFNYRHAIYNALIAFLFGSPFLLLILGNAYSCSVHRFFAESGSPQVRKLAKDLRDFFGNKGACFPLVDLHQLSPSEISVYLDKAKKVLLSFPADTKIKFPIGVDHPIRLEDLPEKHNEKAEQANLEIIASVNKSGRIDTLTARDVLELLRTDVRRLENTTIDIIAYEPQIDMGYLVPDVGLLYLYKDALNSSLNREVKKNDYDLNKLDIRQLGSIEPSN
jgi:hypothetical protein